MRDAGEDESSGGNRGCLWPLFPTDRGIDGGRAFYGWKWSSRYERPVSPPPSWNAPGTVI